MFVKTLVCHILLNNRYCLNQVAKTINDKVIPGVKSLTIPATGHN